MIKIFYHLSTTGLDPRIHSMFRVAGLIDIDGEIVDKFDIKMQPDPRSRIDEQALLWCGTSKEELANYQDNQSGLREFKQILNKYIDKFDPKVKAWTVGFNNVGFGDQFLRGWFRACDDSFYGSYFWPEALDVMTLSALKLAPIRSEIPSFKLMRVSKELGIDFDKSKEKDPSYVAEVVREIFIAVADQVWVDPLLD